MDNVKYSYSPSKTMATLLLLKESGHEHVYTREPKGLTWTVWKAGSLTITGSWSRLILLRIIWSGTCGFVTMETWHTVQSKIILTSLITHVNVFLF